MMHQILVFLGTVVASTPTFFVLLTVISVHIWYLRSFVIGAATFGLTLLLGGTLTYLKHSFAVARPDNPIIPITGYAFPSAHAGGIVFLSFVLYAYIFSVLEWPDTKRGVVVSVLLIISLLICYSRIYFNVHTPIQVLAGAAIGAAFGVVTLYVLSELGL